MSGAPAAYLGADVFDGERLLEDHALVVEGGRIGAILPAAECPAQARRVTLEGGVLAPLFVDLQVNGGGGVMFNDDPSPATLRKIVRAHARLGTGALLPTLITDTPERTRAAIEAVAAAIDEGLAGIAGLHLEGPHLSVARKGAHDPALIRPMEPADLEMLLSAARRLPALMVTLAPESTTPAQVRALAAAGVVVSLGHSDADHDACLAHVRAGARCATHLFNAMSQLTNRAPGLVGAVLESGAVSAGIIADGIHVHPATLGTALRAKRGPGTLFLVTDAMAVAGTGLDRFSLNGREVRRRDGRLTLADGTLAGADLEMSAALRLLTGRLDLPLAEALAMATSRPARIIGAEGRLGRLAPGMAADFLHLDAGLRLGRVWRAGDGGGGAADPAHIGAADG